MTGAVRLRSILVWTGERDAATSGEADAFLVEADTRLDPPHSCVVRILPDLDVDGFDDALAAAMAHAPVAVAVGGIEARADLQRLSVRLAVHEAERDLPDGSTRILVRAAETPRAALVLSALLDGSDRLAALLWDAEKLAAKTGGTPVTSSILTHVEAQVVLAAHACGVPAIGRADNPDEVSRLRQQGFGGAILDTPQLVPVANAAFDQSGPIFS